MAWGAGADASACGGRPRHRAGRCPGPHHSRYRRQPGCRPHLHHRRPAGRQILAHDALAVLLPPGCRTPRPELAVAFCQPPLGEAERSWPVQRLLLRPRAARPVRPPSSPTSRRPPPSMPATGCSWPAGRRAGVMVPIQAAPRVLGGLVLISRTPRPASARRCAAGRAHRRPARPGAGASAPGSAGPRPGRGRGAQPPGARNPRHPGPVAHRHHHQSRIPQTLCGRAEPGRCRGAGRDRGAGARGAWRRPGAPSWACSPRRCNISRCATP